MDRSKDNQVNKLRLVPVVKNPFVPKYYRQGLPGSMPQAFLIELAAERLYAAACFLKEHCAHLGEVDILVWDGYRTRETQQAVFENYLIKVRAQHPELGEEEALPLVKRFVSPFWRVFPHGTGGTADVTLLINGREAWMGTDFDEFTEVAGRDWFHKHPPQNDEERRAQMHRAALRTAMEDAAGFVGHPEEWWHFEYGTERWAVATGQAVICQQILPPPSAT